MHWIVIPRRHKLSCLSLPYQGYEERVFEAERSGDGEYGAEATQQSAEQDEFADVRLHRQTGQVETQCCQVLRMVQGVLTLWAKCTFSGHFWLSVLLYLNIPNIIYNK